MPHAMVLQETNAFS